VFLQNDHLNGLLMGHQFVYAIFFFELIAPRAFCNMLTDFLCLLLCSTHYSVYQFTVSSKIQCTQLLLICTCSTFPCRHSAVALYFYLEKNIKWIYHEYFFIHISSSKILLTYSFISRQMHDDNCTLRIFGKIVNVSISYEIIYFTLWFQIYRELWRTE